MNVEFSFWKLIKYLIMDCQIGQGITKLACCLTLYFKENLVSCFAKLMHVMEEGCNY